MNEQIEISVYRIILELINNVVKHANATKATVQLVKYPDYINITVDDNGKGFETGRATDEKKGIGLGSVAARVEFLKGKMDIDSMPGSGTTVVIDIPLLT
jgi:signal transduction histidine kinase